MTESQDREFEATEGAFLSVDPMLKTFVRLAEEQNLSLGVTLTIHGLLISGNIISYQKYIEGIAQGFESATGNQEIGQILAESFRNASQGYIEIQKKEAEALEGLLYPRYINLSDARFIFGNSIVPTETGVYWRGRLEEVDGFSLGVMSASI